MIALAASAMVWAWWWKAQVLMQTGMLAGRDEPSDQIRADFPLPPDALEPARIPDGMLEGIVRANPFDIERRKKALDAASPAGAPRAVVEPPQPQFIYKGRVNLGARQRAILEDTTSRKTHFLEVGQEVAGCKLLDIQETQVVLSTLNSNEQVVVTLAATGRSSAPAGPAKHVGSP